MKDNKNVRIELRISEEERNAFKTYCEMRGFTMSEMLRNYIYENIKKEK